MPSAHSTTGTERRSSHALSGDGLVFRLADEIEALRQDLSRSSGQRSAKTLSKTRGLRLTLVVLEAHATMAPEAIVGGASLQVLDGHLLVQVDGQVHELGPGQVAVLAENLHEPIQAAERSAFLVTVAWPKVPAHGLRRKPRVDFRRA
jgi:quercetin dioxygenase-like cupin family protein